MGGELCCQPGVPGLGDLVLLDPQGPLTAAIAAVAVASVGVHLIAPYLDNQPYQELGLNHYLAALPVRPVFALFILGVDVWLGLRWFRESERVTHVLGENAGRL